MKTNKLRYFSPFIILIFLMACSTKKDKFINRKWQALNTKYNVLYNGNVALDKGMEDLKLKYKDNYWEILPIERMQISAENILPGQTKNANFDRAEEKAVKAIQKRSMNIDGKEKNPQMDEAHLLLGKSRYYDQRFIPALEAFNYILYKYPESDKIYEAKIWRERTNMRLDNDAIAVKNLQQLLKEIKFKDQIFADANATLAQAFLNLEERDSALVRLNKAIEFTKSDEEKARYRFILGQLYEDQGDGEKAFAAFQSVIDMKRNSPRRYIIQSHAEQAKQFDFAKGDTIVFLKKYRDLLEDRENRPFLDVLNHQMGLFYDKQKKSKQAIKFYNRSLRTKSEDAYLAASNYRNLAKLYFDNAKYQTAGQYYDSTLVRMNAKTREYKNVKKKRDNLEDVIKYEAIAQQNDSILNVVALSESDKKSFYEDYIVKLKKADAAKAKLAKEAQEKAARENRDNNNDDDLSNVKSADGKERLGAKDDKSDPTSAAATKSPPAPVVKTGGKTDSFYFYNPTTVAYGKIEFRKRWGTRALKNNWRLSSIKNTDETATERPDSENSDSLKAVDTKATAEKAIAEEKYTPEFYIKQLPSSQKVLDSLAKDRNFAYYQLGVIYKEKFKEYKLSASKLEQLLNNKPEERLILPSMYNLYLIYQIIDKDKAVVMKNKIISQYPQSRYAQLLQNPDTKDLAQMTPEATYEKLFKQYEDGDYRNLLSDLEAAVDQFTGEDIMPKLELLKANTAGKLKGIVDYKSGLNFVALNYPNSSEGKQAEETLKTDVPILEKLKFYRDKPESWKIIYKINNLETPATKQLIEKVKKFASERTVEKLKSSIDIYTMTENFVVIHGIPSEEKAKDIVSILKDYKDYKIAEEAVVVSNENYRIVQIKKNLAEYLVTPATAPEPDPVAPPTPVAPTQKTPQKNNPKTPPKDPKNMQPGNGKQPSLNEVRPEDTDDPSPDSNTEKPKLNTPPTPKRKP
ncbi:MAG: gliding motility protein [Flavobacterium sp.]|nr:gliding motility protein [Flavobacterium sp.]